MRKDGRRYGGGRHKFTPTKEQRGFVEAMGAFRMKWEEIARLIIDERTGKSISRATLHRKFLSVAVISTGLIVRSRSIFHSVPVKFRIWPRCLELYRRGHFDLVDPRSRGRACKSHGIG
jgi:hypothetical protein